MVLLICTFVLTERVRLLFVGYLPNLIVERPDVQFLSCGELGMVEICVKVVLDGRVSITINKMTQPPSSNKGKSEASPYIGVGILLLLLLLVQF